MCFYFSVLTATVLDPPEFTILLETTPVSGVQGVLGVITPDMVGLPLGTIHLPYLGMDPHFMETKEVWDII